MKIIRYLALGSVIAVLMMGPVVLSWVPSFYRSMSSSDFRWFLGLFGIQMVSGVLGGHNKLWTVMGNLLTGGLAYAKIKGYIGV